MSRVFSGRRRPKTREAVWRTAVYRFWTGDSIGRCNNSVTDDPRLPYLERGVMRADAAFSNILKKAHWAAAFARTTKNRLPCAAVWIALLVLSGSLAGISVAHAQEAAVAEAAAEAAVEATNDDAVGDQTTENDVAAENEAQLLSGTRQLTFE